MTSISPGCMTPVGLPGEGPPGKFEVMPVTFVGPSVNASTFPLLSVMLKLKVFVNASALTCGAANTAKAAKKKSTFS